MAGDGFFDDFTTKVTLSAENTAKLNDLLVQMAAEGTPVEEAHIRYRDLLQQLLVDQGADLEAALRDNPGFVFLEAAAGSDAFAALLEQTATAAASASRAAAAAAVAKAQGAESVPGTWEPPPADADPENEGEDYA